jgi:hypothetical protein
MAGVEDMIRQAERSKNKPTVDTPNEITRWYAKRNGKMFLNELWCEMSITFWAFHSGNYEAVCFGTDFSYTKAHAARFKKMGRFDMHASRGAIVFFTRPGVQGIGHVGLVHTVTPSDLITIEGNSSNAVRLRNHPRSSGSIVGFGHPDYTKEDDLTPEQRNALIRDFKGTMEAVLKTSVEDGHALEKALRRIVREELKKAGVGS